VSSVPKASRRAGALAAAYFVCAQTFAHSASDAYLTLTVEKPQLHGDATLVHAQWDIALRDLDFVLALDDDGDGLIRWGELRRHQAAIARYALQNIHFGSAGGACSIKPPRQAVDYHADGAYAVLFFDIVCPAAAARLTVDYQLFFRLDPSHRGIFVLQSGDKVATAVLSPADSRIEPAL
jgi:hypothetical protein